MCPENGETNAEECCTMYIDKAIDGSADLVTNGRRMSLFHFFFIPPFIHICRVDVVVPALWPFYNRNSHRLPAYGLLHFLGEVKIGIPKFWIQDSGISRSQGSNFQDFNPEPNCKIYQKMLILAYEKRILSIHFCVQRPL